jgi:hypothetical protein
VPKRPWADRNWRGADRSGSGQERRRGVVRAARRTGPALDIPRRWRWRKRPARAWPRGIRRRWGSYYQIRWEWDGVAAGERCGGGNGAGDRGEDQVLLTDSCARGLPQSPTRLIAA